MPIRVTLMFQSPWKMPGYWVMDMNAGFVYLTAKEIVEARFFEISAEAISKLSQRHMIDKSILERIEKGFKEKVDNQVHIQSEGKDRYRVFTPFIFEDGDHFSIILKKEDGGWVLSDEGHTLMHLSLGQSRINFDDKSRAITANQLFELVPRRSMENLSH